MDGPPQTTRPWMEQVLERFETRLVAYARRLVGDEHAAHDVVQDTLLNLCREPRPPKDPRLGPWLFRVCRHRAVDHLRKQGRVRRWEDPDAATAPGIWSEPEASAETAEEVARLRSALTRIPPRQAEVVWLRFRGGLSYRQIAEVTDRTVSHVGFLLHTALNGLARRLDAAPRSQRVRGVS